MRRFLFLVIFIAFGTFQALGQSPSPSLWFTQLGPGSTYTGPIDIVASPTAFYSLRAGSAAIAATGTQKSVNVRRNTDNTTQDIVILTTGALDVASAQTFAGTYTITSGTIASTVLTVITITGTPIVVGDSISGVGVTAGSYIVSAGTGLGGTGTYNLNVASTVSVGEAINAIHGLYGTAFYDQSGNARDASQATAARQQRLSLSCVNSKPCFGPTGSQVFVGPSTTVAQPVTMTAVVNRTPTSTAYQVALGNNSANGYIGFLNAASTARLAANTGEITAAATDAAWHALLGVINGASPASILAIDGSETTGTLGTGNLTGAICIAGQSSAGTCLSDSLVGLEVEIAEWPVAFTSGQRTSWNANVHAYWGF